MRCDALDVGLTRLTGLAGAFATGEAARQETHAFLPDWPPLPPRRRLPPALGKRLVTVAAAALVAPHAMSLGWSVFGRAKQPSIVTEVPAAQPFPPVLQDTPPTMTDAAPDYGG